MDQKTRAELVRAVREERIGNATRFAEEFASRHGLNPSTVRSTISRIRRDLGLLTRVPRSTERVRQSPGGERPSGLKFDEGSAQLDSGAPDQISVIRILNGRGSPGTELHRIAAAFLLRYESDPSFHRAVDQERPFVERVKELAD